MKILRLSLIMLLLLAVTATGAALRIKVFWESTKISSVRPQPDEPGSADIAPTLPVPQIGIKNILIVGLDDVESVNRSDSIILARFDESGPSLRLLSIPRDTRVPIRGHGRQKINHAYAFGGVALLRETVGDFLGVEVDSHVVLGFQSFPRIIDLLGGVEVDVEKRMAYRDRAQGLYIDIAPGLQNMDGKTALKYVRFRKDQQGDIGRVGRQQKFVLSVMDRLKSPQVWPKVPLILAEALSAVKTDMGVTEATVLARFANDLPSDRIELFMLPGRAALIDKLSYWVAEPGAAQAWLDGGNPEGHAGSVLRAGDAPPALSDEDFARLIPRIGQFGVLNGDGGSGVGQRASLVFRRMGLEVSHVGNAKHFNYRTSNILYPEDAGEDQMLAVEALAELCGIEEKTPTMGTDAAPAILIVLGHDKESVLRRLESTAF